MLMWMRLIHTLFFILYLLEKDIKKLKDYFASLDVEYTSANNQ